jgi:ankyrin repeat protein
MPNLCSHCSPICGHRGGFLGIAILFLEYQVDLDAAGAQFNGRTALEGAAELGRIDMLKMLLNAGVNIHGGGQIQYERALNFPSKNGHHAARQMLEEHHD